MNCCSHNPFQVFPSHSVIRQEGTRSQTRHALHQNTCWSASKASSCTGSSVTEKAKMDLFVWIPLTWVAHCFLLTPAAVSSGMQHLLKERFSPELQHSALLPSLQDLHPEHEVFCPALHVLSLMHESKTWGIFFISYYHQLSQVNHRHRYPNFTFIQNMYLQLSSTGRK